MLQLGKLILKLLDPDIHLGGFPGEHLLAHLPFGAHLNVPVQLLFQMCQFLLLCFHQFLRVVFLFRIVNVSFQHGVSQRQHLCLVVQIVAEDQIGHHLQPPFWDHGRPADPLHRKPLVESGLVGAGAEAAVALEGMLHLPVLLVPEAHVEVVSAGTNQQFAPYGCPVFLAFLRRRVVLGGVAHLSACHDFLHPFKFLYGHDGFVGALHPRVLHLTVILYLLLLQIVRRVFLVVGHNAAVEGVFQYVGDHCAVPVALSRGGLVAQLFQLVFDGDQTFPGQIHIKDGSYRFGLFRVDPHLYMFLVPFLPFVSCIPKNVAIPVDNAVVHRGLLTAFHTDGCLSAFILRQRCHDRQPQFAVAIKGVDVVVQKEHSHAMLLQHTGVLQGVHRISGKTGYLTGDDHIEFLVLGILDHPHELGTLFSRCAGDAFINIVTGQHPFRSCFQNGLVPVDLVFQRGKLGFVFRGNTGIDDHSGFSKCCVHYAISFSASTVN